MKNDPLAPKLYSSTASSHNTYRQTTPSEDDELEAPPPYTPGTTVANTATTSTLSNGFSSPTSSEFSSPGGDTPLMTREWRSQPRAQRPMPVTSSPTCEMRDAYLLQPPMSTTPENPWSKYDDKPGCCFSRNGGCCFSRRGGCCFSDTEGCCFSKNKGCCFSNNKGCCFSNHGGCCFGNRGGSCFSSGPVRA